MPLANAENVLSRIASATMMALKLAFFWLFQHYHHFLTDMRGDGGDGL